MTNKEKLDEIREMMGDEATALDAAYVLRELDKNNLSLDDVSVRYWHALIDAALRAGAAEIRALLKKHDIGISWAGVEEELEGCRLLDALIKWHHATDQAVAGTSETCLAGGWDVMVSVIDYASDPLEAVADEVDWWYRAYHALDAARSEPGQPHLEDACELLLTGSLEAAEGVAAGVSS